jgi:hypothetical protein
MNTETLNDAFIAIEEELNNLRDVVVGASEITAQNARDKKRVGRALVELGILQEMICNLFDLNPPPSEEPSN